jgi:hypothetical protein
VRWNDDSIRQPNRIQKPVAPVLDTTRSAPGFLVRKQQNVCKRKKNAGHPSRPLLGKQSAVGIIQSRSKILGGRVQSLGVD